jgi:hypothetical protein
VALYVVKLACERPDVLGRSLSQWDSAELARQLVRDGVVAAISPQTVQRILAHHKLKPWRHHLWLSPRVPRDAAFAAQVEEIVALYTRPLGVWEMVLCVDEKTSLQPRTRKAPTVAAQPGQPVRVEHEYTRKGALNLLPALIRAQARSTPPPLSGNGRGNSSPFWSTPMERLPRTSRRFISCSIMSGCTKANRCKQWFSILQRKRLQIADFVDKKHLAQRLMAFVAEWNEHAHPFQWSTKSVAKVMAKCESPLAKAA